MPNAKHEASKRGLAPQDKSSFERANHTPTPGALGETFGYIEELASGRPHWTDNPKHTEHCLICLAHEASHRAKTQHDSLMRQRDMLLEAGDKFLLAIGHVSGIEPERRAFIASLKQAIADCEANNG